MTNSSNTHATLGNARPRLLVIDDSEVHRLIICKIAVRAGFKPVEAESCSQVMELMKYYEFDGATLDLSLGERAGTEVLRHFAVRDFRGPIIILSGADPEVSRKAHDLGQTLDLYMLDAVLKPVDLAELREQLAIIAHDWQRLRVEA